jgi:hypothetical protein
MGSLYKCVLYSMLVAIWLRGGVVFLVRGVSESLLFIPASQAYWVPLIKLC